MFTHTLADTRTHTQTHTSEENLETWQQIQVFLFIDLLFILTALNFNTSPAVFMDFGNIILFPSFFGFAHKTSLTLGTEVIQALLKHVFFSLNLNKLLSEMCRLDLSVNALDLNYTYINWRPVLTTSHEVLNH